ncbi:MAG TPA: hypothetical protein VFH51_01805, partial [Myxococcota bacterium]|nr:hypothetical protein [Myxococcota bacterium]
LFETSEARLYLQVLDDALTHATLNADEELTKQLADHLASLPTNPIDTPTGVDRNAVKAFLQHRQGLPAALATALGLRTSSVGIPLPEGVKSLLKGRDKAESRTEERTGEAPLKPILTAHAPTDGMTKRRAGVKDRLEELRRAAEFHVSKDLMAALRQTSTADEKTRRAEGLSLNDVKESGKYRFKMEELLTLQEYLGKRPPSQERTDLLDVVGRALQAREAHGLSARGPDFDAMAASLGARSIRHSLAHGLATLPAARYGEMALLGAKEGVIRAARAVQNLGDGSRARRHKIDHQQARDFLDAYAGTTAAANLPDIGPHSRPERQAVKEVLARQASVRAVERAEVGVLKGLEEALRDLAAPRTFDAARTTQMVLGEQARWRPEAREVALRDVHAYFDAHPEAWLAATPKGILSRTSERRQLVVRALQQSASLAGITDLMARHGDANAVFPSASDAAMILRSAGFRSLGAQLLDSVVATTDARDAPESARRRSTEALSASLGELTESQQGTLRMLAVLTHNALTANESIEDIAALVSDFFASRDPGALEQRGGSAQERAEIQQAIDWHHLQVQGFLLALVRLHREGLQSIRRGEVPEV